MRQRREGPEVGAETKGNLRSRDLKVHQTFHKHHRFRPNNTCQPLIWWLWIQESYQQENLSQSLGDATQLFFHANHRNPIYLWVAHIETTDTLLSGTSYLLYGRHFNTSMQTIIKRLSVEIPQATNTDPPKSTWLPELFAACAPHQYSGTNPRYRSWRTLSISKSRWTVKAVKLSRNEMSRIVLLHAEYSILYVSKPNFAHQMSRFLFSVTGKHHWGSDAIYLRAYDHQNN